jgi:heme O synthase-like polyprenyltransferase
MAGSKMKNMKKTTTTIVSLMLLSLAANLAFGRDRDRDDDRIRCRGDRRCVSAPEIDPAQALGALTLLGGTIAVVRGYRRRKK